MVTKRHFAKKHSAKKHSAKKHSVKKQHRMKKGGNPAEVEETIAVNEEPVAIEETDAVTEEPVAVEETDAVEVQEMTGGRRHRRTHKCSKKCKHTKRRSTKRRGGAGILATAALPFGLLGLNNLFGKKRSTKRHHGRRYHKRSFRKSRK